MSTSIPVLSRSPNLSKELAAALPQLKFRNLLEGSSKIDLNFGINSSKIKISKEIVGELQDSEVIIADFNLIAPFIHDLPKAKWIQGTWAGVDFLTKRIDANKIDSLPLVTRFSGNYFGKLMSEYTVTQIINQERDFFKVYENQKENIWNRDEKICKYRSIGDMTIGVMGIGQIGLRIAETLNFFGGKILGYGKQVERDLTNLKFLSAYYNNQFLAQFLKQCDYIVNVLPSTPETIGLLNGSVLENCQERKPVFINIGRGSIISEKDIVNSINNQWISAAILDVFPEEPLSKESVLWKMPQVRITPHVSGTTREKDVADFFKENYQLYKDNKPLSTAVDFKRGY